MANKDPKDMTDEELDQIIDTEVPSEKAPEEPKKPDEEEPKVEEPKEPEAPEESEEEAEEEKPVSRREQLRIQDVLSKLKAAQEIKPVTPTAPAALDYEKTIEADPELIKKLQADREASNTAMYNQGVAQANSIRFHTRLEIDAPRIEAKYPQLDKSNEKFNPALANAVNSMFLSTAGYDPATDTATNPDVRYSDYIESIFELASEIAGEETATTKKNIAKQAAKTGLRPDGSGAKKLDLSKAPQDMTDEELDAVLAMNLPLR